MGVAERSEYDRGCGNSFAAAFSRALLDPEGETPRLVAGPYGKGTLKRYNVYRNNVTVSLISALASIYPAVQRITGMEFFRAMARFYIRANPPTSPLLFEYGRDFPDFIDRYEYARSMPWLSDAARLERAWLDAYHAADMAPLALQTLAQSPRTGSATLCSSCIRRHESFGRNSRRFRSSPRTGATNRSESSTRASLRTVLSPDRSRRSSFGAFLPAGRSF
jgi:hypothetical protein